MRGIGGHGDNVNHGDGCKEVVVGLKARLPQNGGQSHYSDYESTTKFCG